MSEWEVSYTVRWRVKDGARVTAGDWSEAYDAAWALAEKHATELGPEFEVDRVDVARQVGEPWVYVEGENGWYDMHEPGDVIVLKRAHGYRFTEAEVEELGRRLIAMGLTIKDSWNGAGSVTLSFRCTGRKWNRPMTAKQIAALGAPRPASLGEVLSGRV